ncbi:MAG: 23S rRNA (uracil(1939)-C(5))-methyltransferase RlmD [Clostridia bacterium]|nr:23S rRNA (uracil(1939)-C(5))-methyltransferase RlmD [Clostridia bacterium]
MKKNDIYTVEITDMTNLGFGVAKIDGLVVFVSGAVTGDVAEVKIIKLQSSFAVARLLSIVKRSTLRLPEGEERCTVPHCTSCAYRAMTYEAELAEKSGTVRAAFAKEGLSHIDILPIIPSPKLAHYRNKAQYPVSQLSEGEYVIGFYKPKSHTVCEAASCPAAPAVFSDIIEEIRRHLVRYNIPAYNEATGEGLIRHIYLRRGEVSREILLTLVLTRRTLPHSDELCAGLTRLFPDVKGILINVNDRATNVVLGDEYITLWGRDYIFDTLAGVRLKLTAPSFYQVNHGAAELLYKKARELAALSAGDTLLDLYSGVGSIGLSMAEDLGELIGVEIVPSAVECARENAEANEIQSARFFVGDAAVTERLLDGAERALGRKIEPDVIVVDPPRAGCDERLLRFIAERAPQRIVYISCNPSTLARDVRVLESLSYTAGGVTPVDLFPGTGHVETIVCLRKQ